MDGVETAGALVVRACECRVWEEAGLWQGVAPQACHRASLSPSRLPPLQQSTSTAGALLQRGIAQRSAAERSTEQRGAPPHLQRLRQARLLLGQDGNHRAQGLALAGADARSRSARRLGRGLALRRDTGAGAAEGGVRWRGTEAKGGDSCARGPGCSGRLAARPPARSLYLCCPRSAAARRRPARPLAMPLLPSCPLRPPDRPASPIAAAAAFRVWPPSAACRAVWRRVAAPSKRSWERHWAAPRSSPPHLSFKNPRLPIAPQPSRSPGRHATSSTPGSQKGALKPLS